MESKTMSMLQYLPYEPKPIERASDPNPTFYIPSKTKFVGETTTSQTYLGQKGLKPSSFKPNSDNIKIDKSDKIDLNSNYRSTFINHGLTMCEAKAFMIASALPNGNINSDYNNRDQITISRLSTTKIA